MHQAAAQYIRGTIRAQGSEATVQGASITVLDSLDRQLLAVQSDNGGHFVLPLSSAIPFKVTVRKIGWQPSSTDLIHAAANDTLDMDLEVPVDGVALAGVEVNATKSKSFNETAFENAKKTGLENLQSRRNRAAPQRVLELREHDAHAAGHRRENAGAR